VAILPVAPIEQWRSEGGRRKGRTAPGGYQEGLQKCGKMASDFTTAKLQSAPGADSPLCTAAIGKFSMRLMAAA